MKIPTKTEDRFGNNFDAIRLTAAFLVLFTHAYTLSGNQRSEILYKLTQGHFELSFFGVAIFFIISGFLITQSLTNSRSYGQYLRKRFARILPALAVMVLLSMLVLGPLLTTHSWSDYFSDPQTYGYLKNLLLFQKQANLPGVFEQYTDTALVNGALWTLPYEVALYLTLLIFHAVGLAAHKRLGLALWLLAILAEVWLRQQPFYENYYPSVNLYLRGVVQFSIYFGAGVLAYEYREKIRYRAWGAGLGVALGVGLLAVEAYTVFTTFCYVFLPYLIFFLSFRRGLFNGFGQYGDFSYGLYIYGFPMQQALVFVSEGQLTGFPMVIASVLVALPLAWASWHWVEAPVLAWYKRTISAGSKRRTVGTQDRQTSLETTPRGGTFVFPNTPAQ